MNLKKLEAFIMVVEKKSFSDAAVALKSSQPTVSLKIKSLEEEIGFELLDRAVAGIKPTRAGQLVYQAASELTERWRRLEDELNEFKGTLTGTLTIGASTIPGTYLLPHWIKKFRSKFPKVDIKIEIGDSKKILEKLLDHQIDAAFVGLRLEAGKVQFRPIASDSLVLIGPNGHFQRQEFEMTALKKEDFIMREEGSGTRRMMEEYLAVHGLNIDDLNTTVSMGSTEAVIAAVESGLGVTFISRLAALPAVNAGRVQMVDTLPTFQRSFYLATHVDTMNRPIIKAFSDSLSHMD